MIPDEPTPDTESGSRRTRTAQPLRVRRGISVVPIFLLGMIAGLVLSHAHGAAYLRAAQLNVERVMALFSSELADELELLPAQHQLVTNIATRYAMGRALEENERLGFWTVFDADPAPR